MATIPIPLVGGSHVAINPTVDCERTINWYVEATQSPNAKVSGHLVPCPGLSAFATLGSGPVRALFAQDGRAFAVTGQRLVELFSDGSITDRGGVGADPLPATISSNGLGGHQLFLTSNNTGYKFDLNSSAFSTVLSGARFGGFVDGYFVAVDSATSTLKLSALEDGATWNSGDVAQRSTGGDTWLALVVMNRHLWLLGSQTSEVWWNSGNANFPFEPIDGGFFQTGIAAPWSACVVSTPAGEALFWIGQSAHGGPQLVVQGTPGNQTRISTHAVEWNLQSITDTYGASVWNTTVGWTYQQAGHSFYVVSIPDAAQTWAFDTSTGLWAERGQWDPTRIQFQAYRPQFHAYAFGQHLVGDRSTGMIYRLNPNASVEVDGTGIRRVRRVPVYTQTTNRVRHHRLEVELEAGLGLTTGQGSDPQLALRYSDDAGKTFSNELWRSAGKTGEYRTRVQWHRLGTARGNSRVYDVIATDPVPWRLASATVDVTGGTS